MSKKEMANNTFATEFKERVLYIETKAKASGLNWTSVCAKAGVSRATPDRWRIKPPKSVQLVDKLEAIVDAELAAQGIEISLGS